MKNHCEGRTDDPAEDSLHFLISPRLFAAYAGMAADKDREAEAQEWLDAVTAPLDDE